MYSWKYYVYILYCSPLFRKLFLVKRRGKVQDPQQENIENSSRLISRQLVSISLHVLSASSRRLISKSTSSKSISRQLGSISLRLASSRQISKQLLSISLLSASSRQISRQLVSIIISLIKANFRIHKC